MSQVHYSGSTSEIEALYKNKPSVPAAVLLVLVNE